MGNSGAAFERGFVATSDGAYPRPEGRGIAPVQPINRYRDRAEVGLAYANLPCIGAAVQLPFGGVKRSGVGAPHAREAIEAVTERTAWTVNNDEEIEMAQGLSADITTE